MTSFQPRRNCERLIAKWIIERIYEVVSSPLFVSLLFFSLVDRRADVSVGWIREGGLRSLAVLEHHLYFEVAPYGVCRLPDLGVLSMHLGQGRIPNRQERRSNLKVATVLRLAVPKIMHDDSLGGAAGGISVALGSSSFASLTVEAVFVLSHVRRLFDRVLGLGEDQMKE